LVIIKVKVVISYLARQLIYKNYFWLEEIWKDYSKKLEVGWNELRKEERKSDF